MYRLFETVKVCLEICLEIFALPAWLYAIYRMLDNYVRAENFEGLFDIPFIISLLLVGYLIKKRTTTAKALKKKQMEKERF